MATTNRIRGEFIGADSKKITLSLNGADDQAVDADVKDWADAVVTNGDIFKNAPVAKSAAELITTTTTEYDIEDD